MSDSSVREVNSKKLIAILNSVRNRVRLIMMVRYGSYGLVIGTSLAIAWVVLTKLRLASSVDSFAICLTLLVAVSMAIGLIYAWIPRLTDRDIARLTEEKADLKERFSTALEYKGRPTEGLAAEFVSAQATDADRHAGDVEIKELFPVRMTRSTMVGGLFGLILLGVFFLPTLPIFWSREQKRDAQDVKVTAISLQKVAEDKEKSADQQNLRETQKATKEMKALAKQMKEGKLPKKESMVALQKLTQKFEQSQKKLEDQMPKKKMEEAAKDFKRTMDQMQKQLDQKEQEKKDLANKKGDPKKQDGKSMEKLSPEEQKKQQEAEQAMKQMMEQLRKMQQAMEQGNTEQSRSEMEQALRKMAEQMQQQGASMSPQQLQMMQQAMQQLSQALQNTQMQELSSAMQQLAQQMQTSNLSAEQMQQLSKMMSQCAGMCKNPSKGMGGAMMDAQQLASLIQALKEGKLTLSGMPGSGGKMPGHGINGSGRPMEAMKDPGATKPRMIVGNKSEMSKAMGKAGDMKEFAKYLAMSSAPPKHAPNGMVMGTRNQMGDELQINFTGNPEAFQSSSPYYKAVETSKKQAESTLDKENIPAAYKKQVRDYFDSVH